MCGFADRGSGQKHKFRVELLAVGSSGTDVAIESLTQESFLGAERSLEEGCQAVVVSLFPIVHQRMVVALRTANVHAKPEDAGIVSHRVQVVHSAA